MTAPRGQITISSPDHHQTLTSGLWSAFVAQNGVDFQMESAGKSIAAHRLLMNVFLSPDKLLETMTQQQDREHDVGALLEFMYTGRVTVARQRLASLLTMATDANFMLLVDTIQQEQKKNRKSRPVYWSDNSSENGSVADSDSSFVANSDSSSDCSVEPDSDVSSHIDDAEGSVKDESDHNSKINAECSGDSDSHSKASSRIDDAEGSVNAESDHNSNINPECSGDSDSECSVDDALASVPAIQQIAEVAPCRVVLQRLPQAVYRNYCSYLDNYLPVGPTIVEPSPGDCEMETDTGGRSQSTMHQNVILKSAVPNSSTTSPPIAQLNLNRTTEELSIGSEQDFQFQLVGLLESGSLESQLQLEAEISKQLDHQFDQIKLEAEQSVQASLCAAPPTSRLTEHSVQPEPPNNRAGSGVHHPRPARRHQPYQSGNSIPDASERVFSTRHDLSSLLQPIDHGKPEAGRQTQGRLHECEQCGSSFVCAEALAAHRVTHAKEIRFGSFACNLCAKTFARAGNLRNHSMLHFGQTAAGSGTALLPGGSLP